MKRRIPNELLDTFVYWLINSLCKRHRPTIIIAQSVTELQRYLLICERELLWLGMSINIKKSCCMRIGPRYDAICNNILTTSGLGLPWVDEVRYLGVHLISAKHFKCNFDSNKRAFYKSINAVFGRIGRIASEEVVIELVIKKCLPILLYSTEACPSIHLWPSHLTS